MADAQATNTSNVSFSQNKSKKPTKHQTVSQFTIRNPTWAYIQLSVIAVPASAASTTSDALTVQLQLQSALSSFLGLHGTAIPIDLLDIQRHTVWLRVPREDASAVLAALGGWVSKNGQGWAVRKWSCWCPNLSAQSAHDLFDA